MPLSIVGVELVARDTNFFSTMSAFRRQITFLGSSALQLQKSVSAPGNALISLGTTLRNTGKNIRTLGNETAALGFRLAFLASIPVFTAINATADAARRFETEMVRINTLVGVQGNLVEQWSSQLLNIAPSLGAAPDELANALFVVTSAGIRTASAIDIVTMSAKASAIGLGETAEIARTVTSVLQAYNMTTDQASYVTDVLVAIVREGNLVASDLAPTLGRVIGLSAQLGVSFAESGAFIAAFTRAGVNADVAVTSLRGILTNIIKPSKEAQTTLAEFGLTMEDVRRSIDQDGLASALIALRQRVGDNDEAFARIFGNVRGLAGALFITSGEVDDATAAWRSYLGIQEAIIDSTGITQTAFETTTNTFDFQLNRLKSTFEVLKITIGGIFLPALNDIIDRLIPILEVIRRFAQTHPQLILIGTAFVFIAAALAPVLIILGLFISAIGSAITTVGTFVTILGSLLTPIGLVGAAVLGIGIMFAVALPKLLESAGMSFQDFVDQAYVWGKNIVIQLAQGIVDATVAVVQALINLGRTIAHWLRAHSPPKLLPDLPEWGAAAMTSYMDGWANADFDVFNDIASTIENFIGSLGEDVLGDDQGIGAILGARTGVGSLIDQFNQFGAISERTLNSVTAAFGPLQKTANEYIMLMLELGEANKAVAAAQDEINRANAAFKAATAPAQAELGQIEGRREEVRRQQRVTVLQEIISDQNAPELAKELALLELRELQLKDQIALEEQKRDAALAGANEQLAAAEAEQQRIEYEIEQRRNLLEVQQKQNDLLARQASILEQLASSLSDVGAGLSGLSDLDIQPLDSFGGLGSDPLGLEGDEDPLGLVSIFGEIFDNAATEVEEKFAGIWDSIVAMFENSRLGELWNELQTVWAVVFLELKRQWDELSVSVPQKVEEIKQAVITKFNEIMASPFVTAITDLFASLFDPESGSDTGIVRSLNAIWETLQFFWEFLVETFSPMFAQIWENIIVLIPKLAPAIQFVGALFAAIFGFVITIITGVIAAVVRFVERVTYWLGVFSDVWGNVREALKSGDLSRIIDSMVEAIIVTIGGLVNTVATTIWEFILTVYNFFKELYNRLVGNSIIPDMVEDIIDWFITLYNDGKQWISDMIDGVIAYFEGLGKRVSTAMQTWYEDIKQKFFDFGVDFVQGLIDGIGSMIASVVSKVLQLSASVEQAIRQFFGWESPARMTIELGQDLVEGAILGLQDKAKAFALAASSTFTPVIDAMNQQLQPKVPLATVSPLAQSASENTITFGPVYINNDVDQALFEARIRKVISEVV